MGTPTLAVVIASCLLSTLLTTVHSQIHSDVQASKNRIRKAGSTTLPTSVVPQDATILSCDELPSDTRYMPEVGNGHIASVVQGDTIYMNGLYNGANITSHRARIPNPNGYSVNATTPAGLKRTYTLDIGRGIFSEFFTSDDVNITLMTYAHRKYKTALVTELVISRTDVNNGVSVVIYRNLGQESVDVVFTDLSNGVTHGRTLEAEFPELAPETDFFVKATPSLEGSISFSDDKLVETYLSVTTIDVSKDNVVAEHDQVLQAFADGSLLSSHVAEWNKIWRQGRIDVEGDITISKLNYGSLYYILTSLPFSGNDKSWPFIGLSPGGLAHGPQGRDYYGHVFWDQDTWMFPPIALLYPDLGRLLVETRTKTLEASKLYAQRTGWDGARYAWESCFTGLETCPAYGPLEYEIHINGDVPMMVRQYWQLTRDRELMVNGSGADVVWETARYWVSRTTYRPDDDSYRILEVMPPDEWHSPVNDSAFTNYIAELTLNVANQLAREFGKPENKTWTEVSDKLYLPYDATLDYHPEFDGFLPTEDVKQADVVLLGFPLMVNMSESTRANDMIIYDKLTPVGPAPAMTWGMFLLGWLELGNYSKANELFPRSVLNAQEPFLVWTEDANGNGATNFLTGMGGYLQSIIFGYGGARIYDDKITFDPQLVFNTTKVRFTGVNYRGCSFDLEYTDASMTLGLTSADPGSGTLEVLFEDKATWEKLVLGQPIQTNRKGFWLRSSQ